MLARSSTGDPLPSARPKDDAAFQPNLYVVARFLDALARPDREFSRSALQAAVGVNYDIFRRYLDFLERKGYVASGERPALTASGMAVRDKLRTLLSQMLEPAARLAPQTLKRDDGPPSEH